MCKVIRGQPGVTGSGSGVTGPSGPTGQQGVQGDIGITGVTGSTGSNGVAGSIGATGNNGTNGATGATGAGSGYAVNIGDLYGGGIMVDVWDSSGVQHGLIASLTDLSTSSQWSNITTTLIGATAQSPDKGYANTTAMLGQAGATSGAAFLCRNYNGGGYTDWYLPAAWELTECYSAAPIVSRNIGDVNGFQFAAGGYSVTYWSSTEINPSCGWSVTFGNGSANMNNKATNYSVRAVRRY